MIKSDLKKKRDILFAKFPPGQVPEAADLLSGLDGVDAAASTERRTVTVGYELTEYTLKGLEAGLEDQGFHLDNTLMSKLMRALIYYVEETQLHNMGVPEKRLKRSQEAYVHAWEQHPHGDYDETPQEWREYR